MAKSRIDVLKELINFTLQSKVVWERISQNTFIWKRKKNEELFVTMLTVKYTAEDEYNILLKVFKNDEENLLMLLTSEELHGEEQTLLYDLFVEVVRKIADEEIRPLEDLLSDL